MQGYCDASERAYAGIIYLQIEGVDGVYNQFVCSKTRVAQISIPCLELLSALYTVGKNYLGHQQRETSLRWRIWPRHLKECIIEMKVKDRAKQSSRTPTAILPCENYSGLKKLLRVTAYILHRDSFTLFHYILSQSALSDDDLCSAGWGVSPG